MTDANTAAPRSYKFVPLCLAALLVLLADVLVHQKRVMEGLGFLQDRAYVDLTVARSLLHQGDYAVGHDRPIPMTVDVTWRYAVAAGSWLIGNYKASPIMLAALFSAWALVLALRLTRGLRPSLWAVLFAGLLIVLSPGFALDALSGTSQALATLLAMLAVTSHLRGLEAERKPLPISSAFFTGLAACVRLEYATLWFLFFLHALLMSFLHYRQKSGFAYTLVKGLSGFFVIAICLAPMVGWNARIIAVPWPRIVGAPLALDVWANGNGWARTVEAMRSAIPAAYAATFGSALLKPVWARALLALGLVGIFVAMVKRREARAYSILPLLLVGAPAILACVQPYLGNAGQAIVIQSLAPLWVVIMAIGLDSLVALPVFALERGGVTAPLAGRLMFAIPAALVLLLAASLCRAGVQADLVAREQVEQARGKVSQVIRTGVLKTGDVVSDEPGWLMYVCKLSVIDLTGELSPLVLTQVDAAGKVDYAGLAGFLKKAEPVAMFLWTDRFDELRNHTKCEQPFPEEFQKNRPRPAICSFNWSEGP